jgi:hypothetical protein
MSKQLIELVLPRLARPLHRQLRRYRAGQWDEAQFTRSFESLLRRQHTWLTDRGVPDAVAALTIHGAVLVLSSPGLRAEAAESQQPLEVVEFRAVRDAAADVSKNYGIDQGHATKVIGDIVARYGD